MIDPSTIDTRTLVYAIIAAAIGAIVRALKGDVRPAWLTVPATWRIPLALLLGQVAAIVELLAIGTPWRTAALSGLLSTAGAVLGHEAIVEGLRKGREIGEPKPPQVPPA